MAETGGNEAASPRRRQRAREEGQVARSRELIFALVFGMVLTCAVAIGPWMWSAGQFWLREVLSEAVSAQTRSTDLFVVVDRRVLDFSVAALPLLGGIAFTIVLGHWLQHGPLWLPHRLVPDYGRIDPGRNLERWGNSLTLGNRMVSLIKLLLLVGITWHWSRSNLGAIQSLMYVPAEQFGSQLGSVLLRFGCWLGLGLVIVASLDYAWQLWHYEQALRMTPEERREEIRAVQNDVSNLRQRR